MSYENPGLIKISKIHTFFKADFKTNYSFDGERHTWWEIVFVISGQVSVTADDSIYTLERGQAIIHRPDEFHKICSQSGTEPTVIVISFSADAFPEFSGRVFYTDLSQIEEIQSIYEISRECFETSNIYVEQKNNDNKVLIQKLWLRLEQLVFSLVTKSGTAIYAPKGSKGAEIYSTAVKYMEENFDAGLCTGDIAEKLSISTVYLKKIFIKYSGCGVMQYYNRLRARVACTYLDKGKSVKETADLLGFGDQNYFSTFFKRIIGVSPIEFKKKL